MGSEDSTNEDVVNFFTARWSKKFQSRPDCVFTKALALMKSYQIDGEMLFSTSSLQNLETKLTGTYQISPAPAESIALHIFRMKGDQLLEHLESASREQAKFGILLFSFSTQKALQQDLEAKGYPDAASIADQVFRWKDPRCGDPSMQEDFIAALQRRFKGEFFPDRDVCPAIILQERYPFGQSVCREKEFDKIFQFWHSLLTRTGAGGGERPSFPCVPAAPGSGKTHLLSILASRGYLPSSRVSGDEDINAQIKECLARHDQTVEDHQWRGGSTSVPLEQLSWCPFFVVRRVVLSKVGTWDNLEYNNFV